MMTLIKNKKLFYRSSFAVIIACIVFSGVVLSHALADTDESATGWLWGGTEINGSTVADGDENGVGWASMNSLNCDANEDGKSDGAAGCPASGVSVTDYGVHIPVLDQDLHGYAWSENVGWISFQNSGDLNGCPAAPCKAYRDGTEIRGWARILSIRDAGANAGGFGGWIKLHSETGDPIAYGATITPTVPTSTVDGYAWSDEFGWIRFEDVNFQSEFPDMIMCPASGSIPTGGIYQLRAYYISDGDILDCDQLSGTTEVTDDAGITWTTSDNGIADVDDGGSKGLVSGVSVGGPVTITATYQTLEVTASITVSNVAALCGDGITDLDGTDDVLGNSDDEMCDDGAADNGRCGEVKANGDQKTCNAGCQTNICQCVSLTWDGS